MNGNQSKTSNPCWKCVGLKPDHYTFPFRMFTEISKTTVLNIQYKRRGPSAA